ncbi:hypothetical protein [Streptomyces vinaceus]|uniref:hypothetical protein n=1 Tax=Streptomyces vinaceus TaxID=1960 RepID=UPI0036A8E8B7
MARNYFGGTSADVAEDEAGSRLPNLPGRVYLTATDPDPVKDILGPNDEPLDGLLSDERGMIPQFQGPDGTEQLWVDFGKGRIMLTANNVGVRLKAHLMPNADPHGDRAYTDIKLGAYMKRDTNEVTLPKNQRWLGLMNSDAAPGGDTIYQSNGDRTYNFALRQNGSMTLYQHTDSHIAMEIRAGIKTNKWALAINDGKSMGSTSAFRVDYGGNVETAGTITASNIGTARVFSGPADPATQGIALKPGDVWVTYGG